jgi:zinc protease
MERPSTIANYAINIESNELQSDYYKKFLSNINKVTIEDVQKAAKKYFKLNNAQIVVTGKGSEITDNLEKVSFENKIIPIFYFDKYGNSIKKPVFNKEISSDVNVKTIFLNYVNAIGGTDVLNKIKSISTTASVKIPNAPFSPTAEIKQKHPNLTSLVMTVEGMGTLMSQKFDGENGYIEQMGQKTPFENEQINLEKEKLGLFEEVYLDPNKMEIISLNPIDGKDLYKIKVNEKSFRYYDAATNLLIIKEETVNVAGNEITSTTKYSNYKEIEGVLFPYKSEVTSGPQTVVFDITSIKLNEEIDDSFFK